MRAENRRRGKVDEEEATSCRAEHGWQRSRQESGGVHHPLPQGRALMNRFRSVRPPRPGRCLSCRESGGKFIVRAGRLRPTAHDNCSTLPSQNRERLCYTYHSVLSRLCDIRMNNGTQSAPRTRRRQQQAAAALLNQRRVGSSVPVSGRFRNLLPATGAGSHTPVASGKTTRYRGMAVVAAPAPSLIARPVGRTV